MNRQLSNIFDAVAVPLNGQTTKADEPARMLAIRFKNGRCVAFCYADLYQITFDGVDSIQLDFMRHAVVLKAVTIGPLFELLLSHSIAEITEIDALQDTPTSCTEVTHASIRNTTASHQD